MPWAGRQVTSFFTATLATPQHSNELVHSETIGTQPAVMLPCALTTAITPCTPGASQVKLAPREFVVDCPGASGPGTITVLVVLPSKTETEMFVRFSAFPGFAVTTTRASTVSPTLTPA